MSFIQNSFDYLQYYPITLLCSALNYYSFLLILLSIETLNFRAQKEVLKSGPVLFKSEYQWKGLLAKCFLCYKMFCNHFFRSCNESQDSKPLMTNRQVVFTVQVREVTTHFIVACEKKISKSYLINRLAHIIRSACLRHQELPLEET